MGKVACAFGQAAVLVILALVVGLGVNAVRARNSINLTRDYHWRRDARLRNRKSRPLMTGKPGIIP